MNDCDLEHVEHVCEGLEMEPEADDLMCTVFCAWADVGFMWSTYFSGIKGRD